MRLLGIDLGCSSTKWVLLDGDQIVADGALTTPDDEVATVAMLVGLCRSRPSDAVGVGIPGNVDRALGVVRFLPNLPGSWTDFPLGPRLAEQSGRPVLVLNDARAFCLAELTLGAAREHGDALFLTLGTGVGGGIASGGQLLVGRDDRLGEIGHLTYRPDGPVCGCGNRGCLEVYASGPGIVRAAEERGLRPLDAAEVVAAAAAGEPAAAAAVALAGDAIGTVLAEVAALVPAEIAVIGGGVAAGIDLLGPHIEAALARRAEFIGKIPILPAALGVRAGAIGAALAAGAR